MIDGAQAARHISLITLYYCVMFHDRVAWDRSMEHKESRYKRDFGLDILELNSLMWNDDGRRPSCKTYKSDNIIILRDVS